ncbi:hypothetical protein FRC08_000419 [Ceratobasidium sp. 394]|nr:hypothetical protein FRC08_000419 [Ceratobasidium sp. 394]
MDGSATRSNNGSPVRPNDSAEQINIPEFDSDESADTPSEAQIDCDSRSEVSRAAMSRPQVSGTPLVGQTTPKGNRGISRNSHRSITFASPRGIITSHAGPSVRSNISVNASASPISEAESYEPPRPQTPPPKPKTARRRKQRIVSESPEPVAIHNSPSPAPVIAAVPAPQQESSRPRRNARLTERAQYAIDQAKKGQLGPK